MLSYPNVVMPDAFIYLLRSNMQSSGKVFTQLQLYVARHADLSAIVARCFKSIDPELRVDGIIKSLGWHGFRDHLAALYIERARLGYYPKKLDTSAVSEIIRFEENLKDYTVQGYSRAFLLAFYLKLMLLDQNSNMPGEKLEDLLVRDEVVSHLDQARGRSIKIDYALLTLQHFDHFFGHQKLSDYLKRQKSYSDMYQLLTNEQRTCFTKNLLAYGASIGESEVYLEAGV